jgi:hypothetical protein
MTSKKIVVKGKVPKPVNRDLGKALGEARPKHYSTKRKQKLEKIRQSEASEFSDDRRMYDQDN